MMSTKYNTITTVITIFLLIGNFLSITVGFHNSFSSPLIFVTENDGYSENNHLMNNMLRESDINNLQTDQQKNLRKKEWQSFVPLPMFKPNTTLQCKSKRFINNSELIRFTLVFAQMSEDVPEMNRVFNLANLPKDEAEIVFRNTWKDVLLKYGIPNGNDTADSLSKIVSSKFDGFSPEECKCAFPEAYGLPLLKSGILTRYNENYFAPMLLNLMYNGVKKANPTDSQDVYAKTIGGIEMFLKMVGINMVEELPKILLNLAYLIRFYGEN